MKHQMVDMIVNVFRGLGLSIEVNENTIKTNIDTFTIHNGYVRDGRRVVRTPNRAELHAIRANMYEEFPNGTRAPATIRKFVERVRAQIGEIDAQPEREESMQIVRTIVPNGMSVRENKDGDLLARDFSLFIRGVPFGKAQAVFDAIKKAMEP